MNLCPSLRKNGLVESAQPSRPNHFSITVCVGLVLGTMMLGFFPAQATIAQPLTGLLAKKKKSQPTKIPDVTLTQAEIFEEDVAGSPYITLRGQIVNQGPTVAYNTLIYYEIYASDADTLIEAGAARPEPYILPPGGTAEFEKAVGQGGRLKITLMQWKKQDNSLDSHSIMQFYPLTAPPENPSSESTPPESTPPESTPPESTPPESTPPESTPPESTDPEPSNSEPPNPEAPI
jgi:hypothetical protein